MATLLRSCRRSTRFRALLAGAVLAIAAPALAQTAPPERPGPAASDPSAAAPAPPPDTTAAPPPEAAAADAAKPEVPAFFKGTELGGLVDAHYDYFSTKPDGDAQFRNFDTRHNQFRVAMAQIWLSKPPTEDSRAGYKVKLSVGPATTMVQSYEPGTSPVLENVEEGFISYLAPIGKGLQVDFGKFVTQHGAEVIEAKDNWNYSRSLLFALAIPYYHAGVRLTYSPNSKVTFMGDIVNGWNNVSENNSGKTYGAQVTLKPTGAFTLVQNYMAGPEQPNDTVDWRQLADTVATYTVTPKFSLMANYDYGTDTLAGSRVHWDGIGGYARYQASKYVALSPRVEWYDDPSGFTTGTAQTLKEVTGTLELKPVDTFMLRIEYRTDFSDTAVFKTGSGDLKQTQSSIAFGVLYWFSYKG